MSARLSLACLCALLLSLTEGLHPAAAKPPELPADEQIICAPPNPVEPVESENAFRNLIQVQETSDGSLLIGVGVNCDAGLHGSIQLNERNFDVASPVSTLPFYQLPASPAGKHQFLQCALFGMSPAMAFLPVEEIFDADAEEVMPFPLCHTHLEKGGFCAGSMTYYSPESQVEQLKEMPVEVTPNPASVEYTCPYLLQKAAEKVPMAEPTELLGDALGNLEKLAEARKAYRQATYHRHHGDLGKALSRYEMARHLCPGSRYDRMATRHVEQLNAHMARTKSVDHAEEAEPKTEEQPVKREDQGRAPVPEMEQQVAELLERSQVAYAEGCFDAAQELAKQALALAPDSVAANALVYKMHLLIQLQEQSQPESDACPGQEMPGCKAAERLHQLALQHSFPSVDPELVNGLEQILLQVEEPITTGLEMVPEEAIGGEEQESSSPSEPLHLDFDALLRDVANALSDGSCAEVDHTRPEGVRLRFQGAVGGLWIQLQTNGDGHGSFTLGVPLFALPADDLRAKQWVHNAQVLHWIETISGGGEESCENEREE